jgi:hypothetical protein
MLSDLKCGLSELTSIDVEFIFMEDKNKTKTIETRPNDRNQFKISSDDWSVFPIIVVM